MNSGQFGSADFKSDVCQIVNIEHFFLFYKKILKNQENMVFR